MPSNHATSPLLRLVFRIESVLLNICGDAPASPLKKQITIRLDEDSITYFKSVSEEVGIPYQSLINLYLRDCAISGRKLDLSWK